MVAGIALRQLLAVLGVGLKILTGWSPSGVARAEALVINLLNLLFGGRRAICEPVIATTFEADYAIVIVPCGRVGIGRIGFGSWWFGIS